ncbi:MAG TPA: Ig-like domain-containing protein [Kofleriaceae bacterium]
MPPSSFSALNLSSSAGTGKAETFVVGGTTLGQADPDLGTGQSFRYPLFGVRAVRVNYKDATDSGKNTNANSLQQTMTVSASDVDPTDGQVHVRFAVAPVLENPSHGYTQQPYYYVELTNVTRGTILYHDFNVAGQSGVPWNTTTSVVTGNATQWLNWQLGDIAPGPAAITTGDQLKLTVVGSGCSLGGHFGRIYLDSIGPTLPGLYTWSTGAQTASASSNLTYTFYYSNGGNSSGIGAHLDFVTPPQTTFVSASPGASCSAPAVGATGAVSCPLGTLGAGASGTLTITVKIDAAATGSIVNGNYSIGAVNTATLLGAKLTTMIPGSATSFANVSVTQSANRTVVGWGQTIQYTVKVANAGPTAIATGGLTLTDTMPAQLTGVTWSCTRTKGGNSTKCGTSSGSGNISARPKLGSGGELTYTVSGTIKSGSGLGSITHTMTAGAQTTTTDPDTTNNTAVLTIPIGTSRTLSLTKSGGASNGTLSSSPSGISCGSACSSTTGTFADGSSVVLTAAPIGGATFRSWSGACTGSDRTCTITMSGNQSVTATFDPAPAIGPAAVVYPYAGNGELAPAGSAFTTPLAALVTDASGNALSGITVTFAGPGSGAGASFTSVTTTNAAGIATATATANATPGSYAVTASVQSVATPASFSLTNVGPATQLVYLTGGNGTDPQQAPTGGVFSSNLVAIARDAAGNPVPGATITYTVPSSGASATLTATSATSDANGMVQVGASANSVVGSYTITATLAAATPVTFNLQNLSPGPAAVIVVSGSNQSADPSTAFASSLSVVVADALGNALPNVTVTFAAPSSGAAATLDRTQVTTDSQGQASVNATANATVGTYTVSATVAGVTPAIFTLVNNGTEFIDVSSGSPQDATVGASFGAPLVAVLTDSNGNPVSGVTVTFTAPASGAQANLSASTAVTDSSGLASVTATAGTVAGAYTVTASAPLAGELASFALTNDSGPAASISAVSGGDQTAAAGAAFAAPLVAQVADASGNPVAGATVSFAAPSSGATAALGSATAVTDSSGLARLTPTAGTVAGSYAVSASVSGVGGMASFSLTNLVGAAAAIAVNSGSPQSATVGTAFSPIIARVTDGNGSGVAGVTVSFTAPSTGATAAVAATATTDSTGLASMTPTAGTVAGSYVISATVDGVSGSADFSLTNLAGAAAVVAVDSGSPQTATVMTAFIQPLVVHVTDASGNDVSGVTVSFAAPTTGARATLAAATATTSAAGLAEVSATAGQVAGSYAVTASVVGALGSATFTLSNTAGTVATLTATGGDGQSAVVLGAFAVSLAVHAADLYGNAVSGATVAFSAPASGATATFPGGATTDEHGDAQIVATAGSITGAYTAQAASGSATASFALTNLPGAAAQIASVDGTPQQATVAVAFAAPLRVVVEDAQGNVVPDATVAFSAPASSASAALGAAGATTGPDGIAQITASANMVAGAYDVTASLTNGASCAFHLTNTAGSPASIAAATRATPQQMTVAQPYAEPLAVTVRDRYGNPVSGATVGYTAPGDGPSVTLSAITATTDATGGAAVSATANQLGGSFIVHAAVDGVADAAAFALGNIAGSPATLVIVAGDAQRATVDTDLAPLVVKVLDAFANPVPAAVVSFAASAGSATAVLASGSAQSDAGGLATMTAHAGTTAGAYTITASLLGAASPVSFALINTPGAAATITAALESTPQNAQVEHPFAQPLAAQVLDAFANPVPGVTVTFVAPATLATGTLASTTATTSSDGRVSTTITAGTVAGAYAVTATAKDVATAASFALANLAGEVYTITASTGAGQSATVATGFAAPIVVLVQDAHGNAVPDATVVFTAPTSGATASPARAEVTTRADGTAQTTLTCAYVAGSFAIIATADGAAAPAEFALAALPGSPATATALVSATPQAAEVGHPFAYPLALAITDGYGNPVPGAHIAFTAPDAPGAQLSADDATSDAGGIASVLAIADPTAGRYRVTGSVAGAAEVAFELTNTPAAPHAVLITGGGAQRTLATTAFAAPVTARVVDAFGNAIAGVPIAFSAPTTGATATMDNPNPVSDASGGVSVSLAAGSGIGRFILSAQAPGATAPTTTTLEVTAIPTTITASAPADTPVNNVADVTITVSAAIGTPGGTVDVLAADGTRLATADLDHGSATVAVGGLTVGSHTVTASYAAQGSYGASASATVTFELTRDTGDLSGGGCSAAGGGRGSLVGLGLAGLVALAIRRRRCPARLLGLAAAIAAGTSGATASADPSARAIDRYHAASPDSAWFALDSATFAGEREVAVALVSDYAREPLDIYDADTVRARVVRDSLVGQLGVSVTLRDRLRLSAAVVMATWQNGTGGMYDGARLPAPTFAFGDVALVGDVRVVGAPGSVLRIAVGLRLTTPSGQRTNYMSDATFAGEPRVLVAGSLGAFEYAGDASAFLRRETMFAGSSFGSELRYGAALGERLLDGKLLVGPELFGATSLDGHAAVGTPLELELGGHYAASAHLRVGVGAGLGLINAVGEPHWRALLSLHWTP